MICINSLSDMLAPSLPRRNRLVVSWYVMLSFFVCAVFAYELLAHARYCRKYLCLWRQRDSRSSENLAQATICKRFEVRSTLKGARNMALNRTLNNRFVLDMVWCDWPNHGNLAINFRRLTVSAIHKKWG